MNKTSKLILTVAALALTACSNDEPNGGTPDKPVVSTGDVAYLNVRIMSPKDMSTRATSGTITDTDGQQKEYIYGDGIENDVKNAYFYFYDEQGRFVLESNSWTGEKPGTDPNVEIIGDNTVVLTGMESKTYPSWVVTVLNRPENFRPGATLDEMGKIIIDSYKNEDGYFIMTTSSYFGEDNKDAVNGGWRYFATKLTPDNFFQEYPTKEEATKVVDIYVERLAVRVGVDMSKLTNKKLANVQYTETVNGETKSYDLYELDVTVAGEDNPEVGNNTGVAATKVYVAITGWEINSTAKRTNFMKDLSDWNNTTTFGGTSWAWNHEANHRSYWGKSYTYGDAEGALDAKLNVANYAWEDLTQVVGTQVFNGTRVYCNENTNEVDNIVVNGAAAANKTTSILLRAVACDNTGKPLQLVNYLGVEFLKDAFINRALDIINPADYTRAYYTRKQIATAGDGTPIYEYTQVGLDDIKLVSAGNGTGSVKLVVNGDNDYYTVGEAITKTDETGKSYTTYEGTLVADAVVNTFLARATEGESNKAIAKTDGAMFYPLPLAHLNQGADNTIVEGQYGVVRNHIYNLSVTKIKTLGEGVFVPRRLEDQEPEVIDPDIPKDPKYYVESAINILAWKVVSQEVEI